MRFLNESEKAQLILLYKQGKTISQIAEILRTNMRQVREHIKRYKQRYVTEFTAEEIERLRFLYSHGVIKESMLKPYFPTKDTYMIRNKIRNMKKKNMLFPDTITQQPLPNVHSNDCSQSFGYFQTNQNPIIDIQGCFFDESLDDGFLDTDGL